MKKDLRPVYLRLSVTDRCNFRCVYCRPADCGTPQDNGEKASDAELLELLRLLQEERSIYKVRLTGGEPLLRPGLPNLVRHLRLQMPSAQLCLTTNGALLRKYAYDLREAGLERINISLDATDGEAFHAVTRSGRIAATIDGIHAAREAGFGRLKLNAVLMRHFNGECLADLVRFAVDEGCEIRFIELMPCGEGADLYDTNFLSAADALDHLIQTFEYLGPAPASATAERHRFLLGGTEQVVGFITTVSRPFCAKCDRLRLGCRGDLFSCLRSSESVDLLSPWRAGQPNTVRQRIRCSIADKRAPREQWPDRPMVTIGG